jgi:hypothetical protein
MVEHGNESSGSVTGSEFSRQLCDYQFLEDSASYSWLVSQLAVQFASPYKTLKVKVIRCMHAHVISFAICLVCLWNVISHFHRKSNGYENIWI